MYGVCDTALWIGEGNPASSAFPTGLNLAVSLLPGLYEIPELRRIGLASGLRFEEWGVRVHMLTYGGDLFRQHIGWLSLARRVGEKSSIGIAVGVEQWHPKGYPSVLGWTFSAGFMYVAGPSRLGSRMRVHYDGGPGPAYEGVAGITVLPVDGFSMLAEVAQSGVHPLVPRYAVTYTPLQDVMVTIGWQDDPRVVGTGLNIHVGATEAMYGVNKHTALGWTHAMGVALHF